MSKYNFSKIEKKWQKKWREEKIYEPDLAKAKRPFYNLMMFPYPSAEGLHVGNVYAFTGADIYGRMKRMQGYDVFEPIGLDGFGIHSENYALKIGAHPMKQAKISEKRFYKQLESIGNGFAWDKKLETYDPEYYKWTQWIFIQMFNHGLAYRKKAPVNWCPGCMTVLADEQVIAGKCERCSSIVKKKELEQWFFRITKYAERLLQNLEKIDWTEKVKIAQRNWIGKSEGALIKFPILKSATVESIEIFTTRPDTLFGATYIVIAPEHPLLKNNELGIKNYEEVKKYIAKAKNKSEAERIEEGREKTGVELKGIKAINPATGEKIPVFVADYVLGSVGTGAIMAVPAHDQRDFEFAKKFNLPIKMVICPNYPEPKCPILDKAFEEEGYLVDSGKFSGMKSAEAKWKITEFVGGKKKTQYRLRDWLISRQRYWGPPIPIIYCRKCWENLNSKSKIQNSKLRYGVDYTIFDGKEYLILPVPEKDLPVKLPFVKDFRPKGKGVSPLTSVKSFYEVKCPKCGGKARRETDVSDTFLDSAWYYLGYLTKTANSKFDPPTGGRNSKFRTLARRWLPVNLYTGGAEHSVLHLLYVRFLAMALKDMGHLHFEEPFPKFRAHGLLIKEGAKMSKSKGNVVNPDEYIKKFGADALRMYLMFLAPFEQGGDFRDAGILGVVRFLERVWKLFHSRINTNMSTNDTNNIREISGQISEHSRIVHRTIKKVTEDIENLHYNTAISALMILLNELEKVSQLSVVSCQLFLKLLAPFAPHITEELYQQFFVNSESESRNPKQIRNLKSKNYQKNFKSIHLEPWPQYNPKIIEGETFTLIIQINGRVRDQVEVKKGISQKEVENLIFSREKVKSALANQKPKKIFFVPDRLINIVI
jgi:leucyl-tRNA synthetase